MPVALFFGYKAAVYVKGAFKLVGANCLGKANVILAAVVIA